MKDVMEDSKIFYDTGAPIERISRVPGLPSILRKAMQKSRNLIKLFRASGGAL